MDKAIRLISWNLNGLHSPIKRKKVLTYLKKNKSDICFLQETHLCMKEHEKLGRLWGGQIFFSSYTTSSRGVCILVKKKVPFIPERIESDPGGRYIIVKGRMFSETITLVNIYAPNHDDSTFFQSIFLKLSDVDGEVVVGGDFNLTLDQKLDRSSDKKAPKTKSADTINTFMKDYGLNEIWRTTHPNDREYSFYSPVHNSYTRIDYFIISTSIIHRVISCDYLPRVITDHSPISLTILPKKHLQNFYRWRVNNHLLHDPKFEEFITSRIQLFLETNAPTAPSPSILWESLKAYLRGQIISYTSRIKKESRKHLDQLESEIKQLEKEHFRTRSAGLYKTLTKKRNQYDISNTYKVEKAMLRARQRYYELGDKGHKLLAWQLKKQMSNSCIQQVKKPDSTLTYNPQEINDCFKNFYEQLYTSESINAAPNSELFLKSLKLSKLTEEERGTLDQPITKGEILSALACLQSGKSPGIDGYTVEFYKKFQQHLIGPLMEMYAYIIDKGELPPTLQEALISLICKPEKDPTLPSSYRPISLLNIDLKLIAKVIALRLDKYLPSLINKDQTGFIRNRNSTNNLRRLFHIISEAKQSEEPAVVVSLDAEKAFDRVEWVYLFKVLEHFNFGKYFINCIRLLYNNPKARVSTNGMVSQPFSIGRSTRQGCPLSPLLFALVLEPLAQKI